MTKTALIIDPASSNTFLMASLLKRRGFKVISSSNIKEFVQSLKTVSADVLIIAEEVRYKNKTGLDFCRAINAANQGNVPIIVSSGSASKDKVLESIKSGALQFLVKPTNEKSIVQKVEYSLERANLDKIIPDNLKEFEFGPNMTLAEKIEVVVNNAKEIRALPQAVAKITQVSQDEKAGAKTMETAINSDPSIAAMILKRANSAYYKGLEPITEVKQAVVRIGFEQCRKLVIGLSVFKLFSREQKNFGFDRLNFWLHSIATAVLAEKLSRRVPQGPITDAFMAGLLHDFGKVLLDDYLSEHFQKILQLSNIHNRPLYESENQVFGINHAVVTRAIANKWNFPQEVGKAVLKHHTVPKLKDGKMESNLSAIVFLANQMAKASLLGSGGDTLAAEIPNELWESFGFKNNSMELEEIQDCFKKTIEFLDFLGISQKELGGEVELLRNQSLILVIYTSGRSHHLLVFFLKCQGYQVVCAKIGAKILKKDYQAIFFFVDDQSKFTNMVSREPKIFEDARTLFLLTGDFAYTKSLFPEESYIVDGEIDFQYLRLILKKELKKMGS